MDLGNLSSGWECTWDGGAPTLLVEHAFPEFALLGRLLSAEEEFHIVS